MTSPPTKHDPPDDRPGREDADAHPPLGQVEPQRHSADPFAGKATEVVALWFISEFAAQRPRPDADGRDKLIEEIAAALQSVDRAAREECAGIANRFQDIQGWQPGESRNALVCDIRDRIFSSIKD